MNYTVANMLAGCAPGDLQSVGIMQVIPLITNLVDDRFCYPHDAKVSTVNYGTVNFENKQDRAAIVPSHVAYITKQHAQDHAVNVAVVDGKKTQRLTTAMCIQDTQGGMIRADDHMVRFLPFPLRELAFEGVRDQNFRKIWPAIRKLTKRAKAPGAEGHLITFFKEYDRQLAEFVAPFETVPDQVGAIVLINGTVVGIERAPNYEYWLQTWEGVIRDCYGALAILMAKEGEKERGHRLRVPITGTANTASDVADLLQRAQVAEWRAVSQVVDAVAGLNLEGTGERGNEFTNIHTLNSDHYTGQAITADGSKYVYVSIVAKEARLKAGEWADAQRFSMGVSNG